MNHLNVNLIIVMLIAIWNLALGVLVFLHHPKRLLNQLFLIFILSFNMFMITSRLTDYHISLHIDPQILKFDFVIGLLSAYVFYLFTEVYYKSITQVRNIFTTRNKIITIITIVFILLISETTFIIKYGVKRQNGELGFISGQFDLLFVLFILSLIIMSFINFYRSYSYSYGTKRLQDQYLLLGAIIPSTLIISIVIIERVSSYGINTDIATLTLNIRSIAFASTSLFTMFTSLAIIKHRLFGIRVLVGELLFWSGTALFLFATFYTVALSELKFIGSITSPLAIIINILLAFIISLILNIYGRKLRRLIRRQFVNVSFDPDQVCEEFLLNVTNTQTLAGMLNLFITTVKSTFLTDSIGVVLATSSTNDQTISTQWVGFDRDVSQKIETSDELNHLLNLSSNNSVYLVSELSEKEEPFTNFGLFMNTDIQVVVPINTKNSNGVIFIGSKSDHSAYTKEDLALLEKIIYLFTINLQRVKGEK